MFGPAFPTPRQQQVMITDLRNFDPVFNHEQKMFGNTEGLIMESDRRSLAAQNERQDGDIAQLKEAVSTMKERMDGMTESINTMKIMSTSERNFRNETAHGGSILTDIELIEYMDRACPQRADLWKRTFESLYSISFSDRRLVMGNAVEIYNIIYGTIR